MSEDIHNQSTAKQAAVKPLFFYKLNQLRMFGALFIFVTHAELSKALVNLPHLPLTEVIKYGHQALNFFFVLSGFLITYLMLREYRSSGTINIRNFYVRRILRVWPLYYLTITLAFFVGPLLDSALPSADFASWRASVHQHFGLELALYYAVLPNLASCIMAPPSCAGQTWTVGVEEQFYVMWPLLFWLVRKRTWMMMPLSVLFKYAMLFWLGCVPAEVMHNHAGVYVVVTAFINFLKHFDIEGLGLGALAAYLLVTQPKAVEFMTSRKGIFAMVIPFIVAIPFVPQIEATNLGANTGALDFGLADFMFAISYGWLCVVLAAGDKPNTLAGKALNYGGTITYGFYMYHLFAMLIFLNILFRIPHAFDNMIIANIVLYGGAFTLTMIVSAISYEFYEKKFQSLKRHFSYAKKEASPPSN
ncbi:MAG TPA: acyltransferase [Planktothrix sp.]|jgi:peptidoglycan/LPS O-acetylase OafA/YrhL